jgi:alkanesulfonate monooxygenase SsuD/methylene tetrahydromethanopterin reductase-like flavin-dependent oxidoreductase (luciferase family)
MAEVTRQVRIGCLVLANGTRRIETLAATLATIDALSDGRLEVGLGAASSFAKLDFDALDIDYAPWSVRLTAYRSAVDRLAELTGPGSPLGARPVQSPLPIILGGASRAIRDLAIERRLAWNSSSDSVEEFRELKVGQLDPQAQIFVRRTPSIAEAVSAYRDAGATRLVLVMTPPIMSGDITALAGQAGL